jgi:hypothetical protein
MLTRRTALPLAAALLLGMATPLSSDAQAAATAPTWSSRLIGDLLEARRITRGQGVKIALLSDGVAPVKVLDGALLKSRDLVGTKRPERVYGTLIASLLVGDGPAAGGVLPVTGLASGAKLMPVRVYAGEDDPGAEDWWSKYRVVSTISRGIRHAADNGAQVIAVDGWGEDNTLSLTGGSIRSAVAYARSKNAVVVAVSGKYEAHRSPYPIAAPGVLGLGAVGTSGRRDKKVNDATTTTLVAVPGMKHFAIGPGDQPYDVWGAGPALAWGTAVAAMVRSEYPKLAPAQVVEAITSSARHPKGKGRYDTDLGYGYINPIGALNAAKEMSEEEGTEPAPEPAIKDAGYFDGDPPAPVRAVPYDPAILGGFGGMVGAGLAVAVVGLWLMIRRPARPAEPAVATGPLPSDDPPQVAPDAVDGPQSAGASGP